MLSSRSRFWTVIPVPAFLLVAMTGSAPARGESSCEPSPAVQSALAELRADDALSAKQREDKLQELLVKHPDDLFVHEAYSDLISGSLLDYAGALDRYRKLEEEHPSDPRWTFLRARLISYATPADAIAVLDALSARDPPLARARLFLAQMHSSAKEPKKTKEALDRFFQACPDSIEGYGLLLRLSDHRLVAPYAARLRQTLSARQDFTATAGAYSTLWKLEFQAPVERHPALRKGVAGDLQSMRDAVPEPNGGLLKVFEEGYKLTGDADGQKWVQHQRSLHAATDRHAFFEEMMSWQEKHMRPPKSGNKDGDGNGRAFFEESKELSKRWPREPMAWAQQLIYAPRDLTVEELKAIGNKVLELGERYPDQLLFGSNLVAKTYLDRNIDVEHIPAILNRALEYHERELANMRAQPERFGQSLKAKSQSDASLLAPIWSTLATAYFRLGDAAKLRDTLPKMKQALNAPLPATAPPEFQRRMRSSHESAYWRAQANLATLENRKVDALSFLLRARSPDRKDDESDPASVEARALWKELGGNDEGWSALTAREESKKPVENTVESQWINKDQPLPSFALSDLRGRSWKSSELKGRALILVTWATWCSPCKLELPYVEKLYQRTKKRKDIAVISLNVDEEVGLVQPFLSENKYNFPVLLASDYARDFSSRGIPMLWITDAKGVVRLERVGFSPSRTNWAEDTLSAAEKLALR